MDLKWFICSILIVESIQLNDNLKFFKKLGEYEWKNNVTDELQVSSYYLTYDFKLSWVNAFLFCKAFNMTLLMMETEAEQNFVINLINEKYVNNFEKFTHIGGTKEGSNEWYWAETGKIIDYNLKWVPGTPDNYPNHVGIEYCMSFANLYGLNSILINDSPCYTELCVWKFMCEKVDLKSDKKVASLEEPSTTTTTVIPS